MDKNSVEDVSAKDVAGGKEFADENGTGQPTWTLK